MCEDDHEDDSSNDKYCTNSNNNYIDSEDDSKYDSNNDSDSYSDYNYETGYDDEYDSYSDNKKLEEFYTISGTTYRKIKHAFGRKEKIEFINEINALKTLARLGKGGPRQWWVRECFERKSEEIEKLEVAPHPAC